jgi:uncharacterized protein YjiS (DUF1127 family)
MAIEITYSGEQVELERSSRSWGLRFIEVIRGWFLRDRARDELAQLSPRMLKDIGVSEAELNRIAPPSSWCFGEHDVDLRRFR